MSSTERRENMREMYYKKFLETWDEEADRSIADILAAYGANELLHIFEEWLADEGKIKI